MPTAESDEKENQRKIDAQKIIIRKHIDRN